MTIFLDCSGIQCKDILIELLGSLFTWLIAFFIGRFIWKQKMRKDFERNVMPVLTQIKQLRMNNKIFTGKDAQNLVESIAKNLGAEYLPLEEAEKLIRKCSFEMKNCDVCGEKYSLVEYKSCKTCSLGCGVWYKEPIQIELER